MSSFDKGGENEAFLGTLLLDGSCFPRLSK
jgi:hypothetical protein